MKLQLDSSALIKRYILETGSDRLPRLLDDASELGLCILVVPEVVFALNRRLREGTLSAREYRHTKECILHDVHDAVMLQITPSVTAQSMTLLEKNILRALDALHIACALEWQADLFVTADARQAAASKKAGLRTEYIV